MYRYHVAPLGLTAGSTIMSGEGAPVLPGCVLRLRDIPVGQHLFNLEINPGQGGKVVRAAHTFAVIVVKQQKDAVVRLPSGEVLTPHAPVSTHNLHSFPSTHLSPCHS